MTAGVAQDELERLLKEGFPDGRVTVIDLAGDNNHYKAIIECASFAGKSRVIQHKMVYAALKGKMDQDLHALALETKPL